MFEQLFGEPPGSLSCNFLKSVSLHVECAETKTSTGLWAAATQISELRVASGPESKSADHNGTVVPDLMPPSLRQLSH